MRSIETRDDVCEVLATLCRGRGVTILTGGEVEAGLNWRRRFLADDREGWDALILWGQCKASGESIRERYRARGWKPSTFERAWRRAADAIARGLADERVNAATGDANLAAMARLEGIGRIRAATGSIVAAERSTYEPLDFEKTAPGVSDSRQTRRPRGRSWGSGARRASV